MNNTERLFAAYYATQRNTFKEKRNNLSLSSLCWTLLQTDLRYEYSKKAPCRSMMEFLAALSLVCAAVN
jgi:hypothetical protein